MSAKRLKSKKKKKKGNEIIYIYECLAWCHVRIIIILIPFVVLIL